MDLKQPLAYRVRPKTLEEFIGQEHILGKVNKVGKDSNNTYLYTGYVQSKRSKEDATMVGKNLLTIGQILKI